MKKEIPMSQPAGELDTAVDAALDVFARLGFEDAKLDLVAEQAGVSKRMLHYHFGEKKDLYCRALERAAGKLTPPQNVIDRPAAVPVDGVRRFVDSLFHSYLHHPECVQLLLRESLDPVLTPAERLAVQQEDQLALHLERLLLLGQDAGAFRPGISALDVLVLTVSLCEFHITHANSTHPLGSVDFGNRRNVDGMRRLIVDSVLAFLTSNIAFSGYESYVVGDANAEKQQPSYDIESGPIY